MLKLEIIGESLQITNGTTKLNVIPTNIIGFEVVRLYEAIPFVQFYNLNTGKNEILFTEPLANLVDSLDASYTVAGFITWYSNNLGFTSSESGATIIIDDVAPTVTTGGLWYNPSTNALAVGVDGYWVVASAQDGTDGTDGADGADATAISGTGTVISLTEIGGAYYNMSAASAATTYTTTGATLGAFACVLINTTSEPTVTGATKIAGSAWVTGTDIHMWVQYFGATVQYYFTKL